MNIAYESYAIIVWGTFANICGPGQLPSIHVGMRTKTQLKPDEKFYL